MGRAWAILAIFAGLIGAAVYWAPFQLRTTRNPGPTENDRTDFPHAFIDSDSVSFDSNDLSDATAGANSEPAGDTTTDEPRGREPVLVAISPSALSTPAAPATPLAALPEKAIAGFPARPQKELTADQLASVLKQAKYLRAQDHLIDARDLLSDTYLSHRLLPEQRCRLAEELEPLAWDILRSHSILEEGLIYEVQAGDVLIKIAKHFYVPPEFLMKLNGLKNARTIRPGQKLKLVKGPFDVLAELGSFELTVLQRGKFVRRFEIGIGHSDSPTPHGLYKIGTKLVDPTYYPPPSDTENRRPLPAGHPNNPLGSRWLDIGLGYGIHGTIDPESIGTESSRGCIRMRNEDVEQLYDMLTEGSRVLIR